MDSLTTFATLDDGNTDGGCLERNIDYAGDDLDEDDYPYPVTKTGLTAWQCRLLCQETFGCKYFTHAKHLYNIVNGKMTITDNKCHLKSGMGTRKTKLEGAGFTSGAAFCPASNGTYLISSLFFFADNLNLSHRHLSSIQCGL